MGRGTGDPGLRVVPVIPTKSGPVRGQAVPPKLQNLTAPHTAHTGKLRPKDRLEQSLGDQDQAVPPRLVLPTQSPPAALWGEVVGLVGEGRQGTCHPSP